MKTRWNFDGIELHSSGAEVAAVYRAYLAAYGPQDGATQDAYRAAANRQDLVERFDATDADTVARALHAAGMVATAQEVFAFARDAEADELEREADQLHAEAEHIRMARVGAA